MPKHLLDAVKTATDIHKGDYSSLRGKSFVTCDNMKKNKGRGRHVKKPKEKKYTLNQLGMTIDKLAKIVSDGFSEIRQDIKSINTRLDYIVSANNLKDLPKSKSK